MKEIGKSGRYFWHKGRYLVAQIPSTIRLFQGVFVKGEAEEMVEAIRRMTSSASLSSYISLLGRVSRSMAEAGWEQVEGEP